MTPQPSSSVWDERHLRLGITAAGVGLWSWNVDTDQLTMDDIGYDLWDKPKGEAVTFEDLSANIHPADRDRVRAAFSATRGIIGPYEIDFRILIETEVRWISARGVVCRPSAFARRHEPRLSIRGEPAAPADG